VGHHVGAGYAQQYPDYVAGLVLGLVTATTRREVEWMTGDLRRLYPREWDRFIHVSKGDKIPKCPNGHTEFETRTETTRS
jgi:hypothetical protein